MPITARALAGPLSTRGKHPSPDLRFIRRRLPTPSTTDVRRRPTRCMNTWDSISAINDDVENDCSLAIPVRIALYFCTSTVRRAALIDRV
jgi:hypothetical protein